MIIKKQKQTKLKFFNEIKKVVMQKVVGEMNMMKKMLQDNSFYIQNTWNTVECNKNVIFKN